MGENYNVNEEIGHTLPANTNTAHLWRYYIARGFVEPGDVVNDVACGYGYGSGILARTAAKEVRGFDYDKHALSDARKKFPKIHFVKQDLDTTHSLPPCDLSVTIETIEHLDDPDRFAETLRASTRRYIFVTTPFVPTTIEALGDEKGSPYHHHDFSLASLDNIFEKDDWRKLGDAELGRHGAVVYFNTKLWSQS